MPHSIYIDEAFENIFIYFSFFPFSLSLSLIYFSHSQTKETTVLLQNVKISTDQILFFHLPLSKTPHRIYIYGKKYSFCKSNMTPENLGYQTTRRHFNFHFLLKNSSLFELSFFNKINFNVFFFLRSRLVVL